MPVHRLAGIDRPDGWGTDWTLYSLDCERGQTCVWEDRGSYEPAAYRCKSCGESRLPGCYCTSDDACQSLGPGARCYGPGMDGPEYGCFLPSEAPPYACLETCLPPHKVCYYSQDPPVHGTCIDPYCLDPDGYPDDYACEMQGATCWEDGALCYLAPDEVGRCEDPQDGLCTARGGAVPGSCFKRANGSVWECCFDGTCNLPR